MENNFSDVDDIVTSITQWLGTMFPLLIWKMRYVISSPFFYVSTSLLKKYYFELIVGSSRLLVLLIVLSQFFMMKILKTSEV